MPINSHQRVMVKVIVPLVLTILNLIDFGKDYVKMHIDRRGVETFPITIEQHIDLLRRSGFRSVDILWASYLQAGFMAIK